MDAVSSYLNLIGAPPRHAGRVCALIWGRTTRFQGSGAIAACGSHGPPVRLTGPIPIRIDSNVSDVAADGNLFKCWTRADPAERSHRRVAVVGRKRPQRRIATVRCARAGTESALERMTLNTEATRYGYTVPAYNIRAAIGYLLMRLANFSMQSVPDPDRRTYEISVKTGDSLDKIARQQGSTIDTLRALNPGIGTLRPGQVLKYRKAAIRKVIIGWQPMTTAHVGRLYNTKAPDTYAKKLDYALATIQQRKEPVCAR